MSGPIDLLDPDERDDLPRTGIPTSTSPMLATLTDDRFSDPGWIYERKLDGMRCLGFRDGRGARLRSRNDQRIDAAFPELVEALDGATDSRVVVDGEIVSFRGRVTSFPRLQHRIGIGDPDRARAQEVPVFLYLFDILHLDGHDTTGLPLRRRKRLLREALDWSDPLRWTPHRNRDGEEYFAEACRKGWEGLIAKRAGSTYVHSRSRDWLKFKCTARQELVVGGFTDPAGSRKGFGALLLGYHDDGSLRYAGRVGTGFDDEQLERLHGRLVDLERDGSPFADAPSGPDVHWVQPQLVAEVGFTEWTDAGRLRHPRFLGLRPDKDPEEVVRERGD